MAEPNIIVRHTSFWALQCPLRVHKAPQAGGGNSEKVVLYLDNMLIMASSKEEAQAHPATAMHLLTALGVYPQPQQECSNTHSEGDFLGFCLDSHTC